MTYYINPIWFYLMSISTGMKIFLCALGVIAFIIIVFAIPIWVIEGSVDITDLGENEKKILKLFKNIIIASIISLFICILIPSKETCVEMIIASQVTHENVTATKEEIYEIVDYITDKVKGEEEWHTH